ncbi:MAG: hypothetical protein P8X61_05180 [Limibacillus sp.]
MRPCAPFPFPEWSLPKAALALLYHPAVKPGMTEDQFVATLLENDLIDP